MGDDSIDMVNLDIDMGSAGALEMKTIWFLPESQASSLRREHANDYAGMLTPCQSCFPDAALIERGQE